MKISLTLEITRGGRNQTEPEDREGQADALLERTDARHAPELQLGFQPANPYDWDERRRR